MTVFNHSLGATLISLKWRRWVRGGERTSLGTSVTSVGIVSCSPSCIRLQAEAIFQREKDDYYHEGYHPLRKKPKIGGGLLPSSAFSEGGSVPRGNNQGYPPTGERWNIHNRTTGTAVRKFDAIVETRTMWQSTTEALEGKKQKRSNQEGL